MTADMHIQAGAHATRIPPTVAARLLRRLVMPLRAGSLALTLPDGDRLRFDAPAKGPSADLSLRNWAALARLMAGGEFGFVEAFRDGDWTSGDLTQLLELVMLNEHAFEAAWRAPAALGLLSRLRHRLRANTRSGSKRNISAHYDLGNEFYGLWLDPTMSYSSAIYSRADQCLSEAQDAKLKRVVELLRLSGSEHVLEIGCGWGSLASRLAGTGCRVTAVTLSAEQARYAATRVAGADGIEIRLQDYRDISGSFDRIVSIEMVEAVGEPYWPLFFRRLRECLKPGGVAVLQSITIEESRFESYRRRPDFIQSYVFPGGMLPTAGIIRRLAAEAGLCMQSEEFFGDSYARTLADWRTRFLEASSELERLGFDARFRRLWEYYLAYCEAGFRTRAVDVGLYVLRR